MHFASQRGWVAWSFSLVLLVAGSALSWFYWEQSRLLTDSQNQNQAFETRLDRMEQQLEQRQTQLDTAQQARQTLTQERDRLSRELEQLRNQQDSRQSRTTALQTQLEQAQQTLAEEQSRTNRLTSQLEEQQQALSQTEQSLSQTEQALAQTEQALAQSEKTAATAQAEIDRLTDELAGANRVIAEQRGALNEAATTEERYLAARQQLALEQAENETYSETVERLRQEMAAETTAMNALEAQLQSQLSQLNQEKEQLVTKLEDGTTAIKLPESILFASGSADINVAGRESLANLANALDSFPNHLISIQGHTDSQTIAPTTAVQYPTNWELSAARAASAVRELLKQGIPADQMQAVGFADTRPLVSETSAQARQQNRRIEVILLPNQFTTRVLESPPG